MTKLATLKREWMKEPAFKAEYDALESEFAVIHALIGARIRAGLTQAKLAERMGTTQSAVARLEGGSTNPSVDVLRRYAKATGSCLKITLEGAGPS